MARTLAASILLALVAGAGAAAADPPTPAACDAPPARSARGIRAIDWCNADVGTWRGRLVRGHSDLHLYRDLGQPHDSIITSLRSVDYADVDGDRRPEALLVIEQTTWIASDGGDRSSTGSDVKVYALRGGKRALLGSIPTGTPVLDLRVRRGVVELISGPDRARTRHRWDRRRGDFVALPAPAPRP